MTAPRRRDELGTPDAAAERSPSAHCAPTRTMAAVVLAKILRAGEGKMVRRLAANAEIIESLEDDYVDLTDAELREQTDKFKERLADGETLYDIMPEAFAVVREAARRTLGQFHYKVQLMGGNALHDGNIAEMRTGEGKTLVSTLPAYLNALEGKGVHIVTVNDYLAGRDADWMGRVHRFLGLSVGKILSEMPPEKRKAAYNADITYGTNNEFGFDYLRDNMVFQASERVQRGLAYGIIDEVDSILIDEARTPLIISGQADDNIDLYYRLNELVPRLTRQDDEKGPGDYWVDEKAHQVLLSEEGHEHAEQILGGAGLTQVGSSLYDA